MAAKRKGLMPAFLNLSKLVSAPNAAMDMVRRKVSSWLIQSTMLSGSKSRELNPITTRKRMANHGMLILGLLISVFSRLSLLATSLATVHAITSNTGTSIITPYHLHNDGIVAHLGSHGIGSTYHMGYFMNGGTRKESHHIW